MKNLFSVDISNADVVYVFGMPDSMKKHLRQKLEKELKSGSRVISYAFQIPGWIPKFFDQPDPKSARVYVYEV